MTGFGLVAPIHASADYDNTLTHIGIGEDLHSADNDAFRIAYGRQLDALARATGQRSLDLANASGFFSREGFSADRLNAVLPTVAHIATAYNAAPDAVARTTFALGENMGVDDHALGGALSAIAIAGKQADLPFERLAPLFPEVASMAGQLGVRGRSGVDDLASLLAVMRKNTGTEGEAVTDTRAFIQAITSPHTARRFAGYGVDLFGVENNARRQGLDPMMAVLQQVNRITRGGSDTQAMGTLFNNQEDRAFATAILRHMDQFTAIRQKVAAANSSVIDKDFDTGLQSTLIRLQAFEDALAQLERRIGTGFVPIMNVMTKGLHGLTIAFEFMDKYVPGLSTGIIGIVGGFLALATVLGVIGAAGAPIAAAFGLIGAIFGTTALAAGGVVVAVAGIGLALVGAGYVIYRNWTSIKASFTSFDSWLSGWVSGISGSIGRFASALGNMLLAGLRAPFEGVMRELHQLDAWFANSQVGHAVARMIGPGNGPVGAVAAGGGGNQVHLHVSHDPGLAVRPVSQGPARVTVHPDRGRMTGRP
nr:phage tail tape measure protein [Gluconacetobacter azotocaptans]